MDHLAEAAFIAVGTIIMWKVTRPRSAGEKVTKPAKPDPNIQISPPLESFYVNYVGPLVTFLMTSIPPGPRFLPLRTIINIQKGGTMLYVFFLMKYFDNFSMSAYLYLSLHGTYGLLWLLKDQIFPDPGWEQDVTVLSYLNAAVSVLGPYWVAGYLTVSRHVEILPYQMAIAVTVHTLGCVLMMASDSQKYFTLKYKKGLISEGWFARCRNTNYLGEMMLYGTYAYVAQHPAPWAILAYIWGLLFARNMFAKEASLRKKEGYTEYAMRSGFLIPKFW
eukprot:TRINITY_DN25_c0_g1::TRINITY_DN25_c0_g1_i1::g.14764::m.14764 TRINITY_DN25_c0_g1::TRINITY_DN25_c0_g1_i1::g.14764  ORF type:complete len:296 (-),score=55.33,DUF1295/PF06966.7/0.0012,Steroid_dh/PF02544.11/7.8e+03,Steroid_dh/PF02544.11/0.0075 TRINITY_DN25_c0_g1_i1:231-1061(-)